MPDLYDVYDPKLISAGMYYRRDDVDHLLAKKDERIAELEAENASLRAEVERLNAENIAYQKEVGIMSRSARATTTDELVTPRRK
jgi:cell division protein FtsB